MQQVSVASEPWMRGTHRELDPVRRAVVHALELAEEDAERWCAGLREDAMFARPLGLAPVAFHLRHVARSLDRLLTYAEGRMLDGKQLALLGTEMPPEASCEVTSQGRPVEHATAAEVLREFRDGVAAAKARVMAVDPATYPEARGIGRQRLPATVGGLLIHCAEHTQRHVGQMVTTAKVVGAAPFVAR